MNFSVQNVVEGLSFRPFQLVSASDVALLWFAPIRRQMFFAQIVRGKKTAACIVA